MHLEVSTEDSKGNQRVANRVTCGSARSTVAVNQGQNLVKAREARETEVVPDPMGLGAPMEFPVPETSQKGDEPQDDNGKIKLPPQMFIGEAQGIAIDANNTMEQNGDVDVLDLQKDILKSNDREMMSLGPGFEDSVDPA